MSGERIAIAAAGWRADLLPAMGGSLLALSYNGYDILRPTVGDPATPLETACFALVPYTNRIADGRFSYGTTAHVLPRNFEDHPHSLHGVGWQRAWQVYALAEASVTLSHVHDGGDGWPWRYHAEQQVALADSGCRITLSLTNTAGEAMPAGLGLHPYFAVDPATRLTARAERVWLADATMLPTEPAAADHFGDWTHGDAVAGATLIDNAYEGWDGQAELTGDERTLRIDTTGACAFHLYRPPGAGYACLEPVSHLPDALNRWFAIDVLAPGQTLKLEMRLSV